MRSVDERKAQAFWAWFERVARSLQGISQNEQLLSELDARVRDLGEFAWEIGPGLSKPNMFALSPSGDRESLALTRLVVSLAPKMEHWEFHPAKPKKKWKPIFSMRDDAGRPIEIDASRWRYVVLEYPDGFLQAVVEAPNVASLDRKYQIWAGEIVLDGMLGEERRLDSFDEVEVVSKLSAHEAKQAHPITELGREPPGRRSKAKSGKRT